MNQIGNSIEITFRIPGNWGHPRELVEQLPAGFGLQPEALVLPDGAELDLYFMQPDDQFPQIFRSSCRRPAASWELEIVDNYTVNIGLTGPGGSLSSASAMMQAAAAIVRAGGAGVFIDNSGLAHGGQLWLQMADDGGSDALSFAYVGIVRGQRDIWTMGMHVMGLPDIIMQRSDPAADESVIIEFIRYICRGEKPVEEGHVVHDETGPRFQVAASPGDELRTDSPMHNPFGRLKLVSIKEIAESN